MALRLIDKYYNKGILRHEWEDFIIGNRGERDGHCIFCRNNPNSEHVIPYSNESAPVGCCSTCFQQSQKVVKTGMSSIYRSHTNDRLNEYISGGFPKYTRAFLEHEEHCDKCAFCYVSTERDERPPILIYPPFGDSDTIDGGVKCCSHCEFDINLEETNGGIIRVPQYTDTCVKCEKEYEITHREDIERTVTGNYGNHFCPNCLVTNHPLPGLWGSNRYLNKKCNCGQVFRVDLSLEMDAHKIECGECVNNLTMELNTEGENNYYIEFFPVDQGFGYLIYDLVDGYKKRDTIVSDKTYPTKDQCMLIGKTKLLQKLERECQTQMKMF